MAGKKAKQRSPGRTPGLTPVITAAIVKGIHSGNYPYIAAQAAGVKKSTFYDWLHWGDDGKPGYSEFSEEIHKAEAALESRAVGRLTVLADAAMPTTSQPLIALLERRFPERWSRGERREIGGMNGNPCAFIVQVPDVTDAGSSDE